MTHSVHLKTGGMLIVVESYTAWCRLCDSSASPAPRDEYAQAADDLTAHLRIQHPETEADA